MIIVFKINKQLIEEKNSIPMFQLINTQKQHFRNFYFIGDNKNLSFKVYL